MSENLPPTQPGQPAEGQQFNAAYQAAPQAPVAGAPATVPGKTLGIVGLILAFLISFVGLVLSIIAVVQSKRAGAKNIPGVIGIVIGALGTIGGIIAIIIMVGAFGMGMNAYEACLNDPTGTVEIMGQVVDCTSVDTGY